MEIRDRWYISDDTLEYYGSIMKYWQKLDYKTEISIYTRPLTLGIL